ncbi:fimbrial protein [Salmonella enterica]|uniref:Adhesion protein n=2 Tax=Salmonella enterica I TaxID=59201 RepID=A0A5X6EVM0_SALET|nr:adhesion protein [Salmonella enterica]EBV8523494.1 adhesion protein [Salmonella enterica subsp. enterica serovar Larochelle]ECA3795631.1 adhesion protein [Salmonella enterica subsp. enterica serovar Aqua]ECN0440578.1 fimbrial protein [Salmonella enterica subsp. enterica serovar Newport]ECV0009750.1 adhesion protein [Salmonella enterica subsp. enterica serovar Saintpaul]EDQ6764121.1 fimbrial protein [Salmonella enterica subsp. enterica serovar Oranienburg]EDS1175491.1 fimbrial protein [Salm
MTARLFNMKSLILSGAFMLLAVCDPAQANFDWSKCDANGNVNIPDINLKGGQYSPGQELHKITVPISYTCTTTYSSIGSLVYSTAVYISDIGKVVSALKNSGLGMDIIIQEGGRAPVTFPWKDIVAGFSGWTKSKTFGQVMEQNKTYNRSGILTFRIFVDVVYKNTFLNINIPASTLNILPYNPTQPGISVYPPTVSYKPLTISAFNLRFIPDNSGRVIISPSVVNLGHFYTEYKDTMVAREAPFTVTAQQNIGTQSPFVAPLAIEFKTNDVTSADSDTSVTLKNTKGEANGFRLSVVDDSGNQVHFNKQADMGSINLDNASGGKIIKNYKAKVEPIPGAEIKTGNFSAAMTVVVTYN